MAYERKTIDISISNELRDLLVQIKGDSEVAKLLLRKRHSKEDLVDSPVDYISMSIEDKGKISYLTLDRIANIDADEYWTSSRRYHAKPGAFVTKLFKNVSAKEVEKFSNIYRAQANKVNFNFEVVRGERIRDLYHGDSYSSTERGSLGASCMKHDCCQDYFDVYTENEQVSMLAMFDENEDLIGRALLWDFDGHKIMDRIYAKNDEELSFHFKKWATENNYLYKSEQNWYNTLFFENLKVKKTELQLEVKLANVPRQFPYVDTFKFIDMDNGIISNYITSTSYYVLTTTSGEMNDIDSLRFDGISRVFRYRNDSVYLSYRGFYTSRENTHYSRYNDLYIARDDAFYDHDIQDYVFKGEYESQNSSYVEQLRAKVSENATVTTSTIPQNIIFDVESYRDFGVRGVIDDMEDEDFEDLEDELVSDSLPF